MGEEIESLNTKLNNMNAEIRKRDKELHLLIAQRNDYEKEISKIKHIKEKYGLKSI